MGKMATFEDALRREIADLERAVEATPEFVKLREARRLLLVYEASKPKNAATEMSPSVVASSPAPQARFTSGVASEVLRVVRAHLARQTRPIPTRELMDVLAREGVQVGGSTPQNAVSSILSKVSDIQANGRLGWSLVKNSTGDATLPWNASPVDTKSQDAILTAPQAQGREAGPGGGT